MTIPGSFEPAAAIWSSEIAAGGSPAANRPPAAGSSAPRAVEILGSFTPRYEIWGGGLKRSGLAGVLSRPTPCVQPEKDQNSPRGHEANLKPLPACPMRFRVRVSPITTKPPRVRIFMPKRGSSVSTALALGRSRSGPASSDEITAFARPIHRATPSDLARATRIVGGSDLRFGHEADPVRHGRGAGRCRLRIFGWGIGPE